MKALAFVLLAAMAVFCIGDAAALFAIALGFGASAYFMGVRND